MKYLAHFDEPRIGHQFALHDVAMTWRLFKLLALRGI